MSDPKPYVEALLKRRAEVNQTKLGDAEKSAVIKRIDALLAALKKEATLRPVLEKELAEFDKKRHALNMAIAGQHSARDDIYRGIGDIKADIDKATSAKGADPFWSRVGGDVKGLLEKGMPPKLRFADEP
jgi:hypothetical protein